MTWMFAAGVLLLFGGTRVVSGQADGPNSMGYELKFLDMNKYPLAVCNDGSPGAFYVYKGDPQRWVVWQQGGWWCWDDYSCQVRWDHFARKDGTSDVRTLMSSVVLANRTAETDTFNGEKQAGVLSTNKTSNPDFAAASKVFIAYCSSDSHAGNVSAGVTNTKWHFRGKEIVKAVIAELADTYSLASAETFVLTGSSAGGMATINNADFVHGLVDGFTKKPTQYIAYPDSGFFLDVQPHRLCDSPGAYECKCAAGNGCGVVTLADQMMKMINYTFGQPDESCATYYGKWGAWRCYLGQYASQHLESTTLYMQMQIDEWQGFWNGFTGWKTPGSPDQDYALWFRGESARVLAAASGGKIYVHSPNCFIHGVASSAIWWDATVDGYSPRSMLSALVHGHSGVPNLVMDGCEGLQCSQGCTSASNRWTV